MRTTSKQRFGLALITLLGGLLLAAQAGAVTVTAAGASGLAGQTVNVAINTTTLNSLNVDSYQFGLSYNSSAVTPTGLVTVGTLSAASGWTEQYNVSNTGGTGTINVSAAGTGALSGSGALIIISFQINPTLLSGGNSGLNFTGFMFNEGAPKDTTSNGLITINATPSINVSPSSGEIVRGSTLQFTASGNVTPPVTWSTTDNTIATIGSSSGLLTGVAPGSVQVTAVDHVGLTATTTGVVLVRGMGVTVGTGSTSAGSPVSVPVTVTTLAGLGVRSGQFSITYNPAIETFTSVTTPAGTLLNGYGSITAGANNGVITVAFAGTSDVTGSGTLFDLNFSTVAGVSGGANLTLNTALFNETLPALRTNGFLSVNGLPTLGVNPNSITLFDGQTQTFTATGGATPPLTWSTLNPAIATINPSTGLLTAVSGGVTQVKVVDNLGATGISSSITVYDCTVTLGTAVISPGGNGIIPLTVDRDISALGVYSMQYWVNWSSSFIASATSASGGITSAWTGPVYGYTPGGKLEVATAGTHAGGPGTSLGYFDVNITANATTSSVIPLTLTNFMFNEGHPLPLIVNGQITIGASTGVDAGGADVFALGPAEPNPAASATRIAFTVPKAASTSDARLDVFGLDGRRVRTLFAGPAEAGAHVSTWDLADEAGRRVSAGVYFVRLLWGGSALERRIAVIR